MEQLLRWSEGNPGALEFLMAIFIRREAGAEGANTVNELFRKYKTLRGANIYVLYSDLCAKDIAKAIHLLDNCPQDILEDACNRQDYSGRELVAKYMIDHEG